MRNRWGFDIGGTKIEGVILDANANEVIRTRIKTEAFRGYEHILGQVERLTHDMETKTGMRRPSSIGFGTPGATEPTTGLLKNSNSVCLNGKPLWKDLEQALGIRAVLANDANCFALAESLFGAGRGRGVVVGLILGTGVGSGVVVNGQVLNGLHGIAGEWGHNVLDPQGRECYCGKRGCVETCISGPQVAQGHLERTGQGIDLREIVTRSRQGDLDSKATIKLLCTQFGQALSVIVNILDPDAIIIGGGVGKVPALYTQGKQELAKWSFTPKVTTPLLRPQKGDSAGVYGAAMLVTPD